MPISRRRSPTCSACSAGERPVQRAAALAQRLRLIAGRRPARGPRLGRGRRHRTAPARPSPRRPRPDRSGRRWRSRHSPPGRSTRATSGSSAGFTKRRLACRAFGQGSGNIRNSRSRQPSGSSPSRCRASSATAADCGGSAPVASLALLRPGGTAASRCRSRTPRRRSARPAGLRGDLRQRVLAAAEADLQPQRLGRRARRRPADRPPGPHRAAAAAGSRPAIALARPQRVAAAAAIEPVGDALGRGGRSAVMRGPG